MTMIVYWEKGIESQATITSRMFCEGISIWIRIHYQIKSGCLDSGFYDTVAWGASKSVQEDANKKSGHFSS